MYKFPCGTRFLSVLALLLFHILLPAITGAQGGQTGFGPGGRISEAAREGDPASFQHILTPGDRGEWPLTVRAGETAIVFVSSTNFDPAVQIVDAAGKVLVENDDIRPGVQDALALYRFPAAGEFKILVKGFKSAAGGRYTLTLRRFVATDLRKAERNVAVLGRSRTHWHRFSADVGETLVVAARSAVFDPETEIFGPTGERVEAAVRTTSGGRSATSIFRAETKGDYYLRVASARDSTAGYAVTVATARVTPLVIGAANPMRRMEAGGLDLWTFAAKAGDLIRVHAGSSGANAAAAIRYLPAAKAEGQADAGATETAIAELPSDPKAPGDLVALIKRSGNCQIEVSQRLGLPVEYTLSTAGAAKPWPAGAEPAGRLPIGGSEYWAIEGKSGQIVKIEGLAEPFDIALDLYNPQGDPISTNDDGGGGHNALITALLKESGRYLLRVHAFGDGGSGAYRIQRKPDPVRPVKIGGRAEGVVGTGSSDIWSFEGKAGQTVILSVRSRDFDTHAIVFGPDAIEITNDDNGRDDTDSLVSVRLPLTGVYTIWVSSRNGGGKYVVRLVDAD